MGWRTSRRATTALLVTVGLALATGACSSDPDPKSAAKTLAAGLAGGDLGKVAFATGVPSASELGKQRTAAFAGLGEQVKPSVTVASVKRDGATAAVTLAWTWPLVVPAIDWHYTTGATLTLADGTWRAAWSSALLAPGLAEGEKLTATRLPATRGDVLGAGGAPIVQPRLVARVGIDKTKLAAADVDAAARGLAGALRLDLGAYAAKVAAAGPKAFVEAIVLRTPDPDYDLAALSRLPAIRIDANIFFITT